MKKPKKLVVEGHKTEQLAFISGLAGRFALGSKPGKLQAAAAATSVLAGFGSLIMGGIEPKTNKELAKKALLTQPLAFIGGIAAGEYGGRGLAKIASFVKARKAVKAAKAAASGKGQAEVLNKAGKKVGKAVFRRINGRIIMIGKK